MANERSDKGLNIFWPVYIPNNNDMHTVKLVNL